MSNAQEYLRDCLDTINKMLGNSQEHEALRRDLKDVVDNYETIPVPELVIKLEKIIQNVSKYDTQNELEKQMNEQACLMAQSAINLLKLAQRL